MDNEKKDKVFVDGLMFKEPNEGAPEYVIGRIWIKVDALKAWLDEHNTNNGGVNIDIKRSTKGNIYCELDTWKPNKPAVGQEAAVEQDVDDSDVPF